MITVSIQNLQEEVRKIYDEIGVNVAEFLDKDIDDNNLDAGITSKVSEAVRYVHLKASPSRLHDALPITVTPVITGDTIKKATITVPNDFLRLAKLKLSEWTFPIYQHTDEYSPEYHKQTDKHACGTWESPIAFLVKKTSSIALECYSAKTSNSSLEQLLYVPEPNQRAIYSDLKIDICEKCKIAIVYRIAGLALINYNNADKAKTCFELCELNLT